MKLTWVFSIGTFWLESCLCGLMFNSLPWLIKSSFVSHVKLTVHPVVVKPCCLVSDMLMQGHFHSSQFWELANSSVVEHLWSVQLVFCAHSGSMFSCFVLTTVKMHTVLQTIHTTFKWWYKAASSVKLLVHTCNPNVRVMTTLPTAFSFD